MIVGIRSAALPVMGSEMSVSCGASVARARAPSTSIIKLIHRICMIVKGLMPKEMHPRATVMHREILTVSWNCRNLRQFYRMFRPQLVALTTDSILSSRMIKSALFLTYLQPDLPIANPTLDSIIPGTSARPSAVKATV